MGFFEKELSYNLEFIEQKFPEVINPDIALWVYSSEKKFSMLTLRQVNFTLLRPIFSGIYR